MLIRNLLLGLMLGTSMTAFSQDSVMVENKDIKDAFAKKGTPASSASLQIQVRKNYISVLPVVGYAPATGFVIGTAISFSRLFDPHPTNVSAGMINAQITSKKQFILNLRSKVYLKQNKWFLQGDWRFLLFAQPTYGLGIHKVSNTGDNSFPVTINGGDEGSAVAQDMRFNYFRLYEDVVRQLGKGHWYLGIGIAFDQHYSINDQELNLDSTKGPIKITDHYSYSVKHGFDPKTYITNGFNFNVLTDTRDNVATPYKGYLFSVSYRVNPVIFKSSQKSSMISYDARYYWNLSHSKPRHLIGFWSLGSFVLDGNVPYLALPSIGWDTYNRSGRGYIQGRFRGLSMIYNEIEYRFPITSDGFFGGVVFANGTWAKSETQALFDKFAPAGGVGLRMKMDKVARVNLTVDYGVGHNSSGIYFNLQETF